MLWEQGWALRRRMAAEFQHLPNEVRTFGLPPAKLCTGAPMKTDTLTGRWRTRLMDQRLSATAEWRHT